MSRFAEIGTLTAWSGSSSSSVSTTVNHDFSEFRVPGRRVAASPSVHATGIARRSRLLPVICNGSAP
jgi:hypothetical protein